MKLSEGLYRVDGIRGANAYIVETDDGLLVVDTGLSGNAERIVAAVRGIGYEPGDVRTIVLTHSDPDHVGSVARLKELTGAKVAIHADDAAELAGRGPGKKRTGLLGVVVLVISPFMHMAPVDADIVLNDGDPVSGFKVMHTPGHTPGSITLYREGIVFSGDTLLSDSKGHVRPPIEMLSADYEQALASADTIRALGYRILLPGHGAPVIAERGWPGTDPRTLGLVASANRRQQPCKHRWAHLTRRQLERKDGEWRLTTRTYPASSSRMSV